MWRRCEMEASTPASRIDLARALRQTAITALTAFGLLLPLIGFNTVQNIHNELVLETRWPLLAALVAIIAAGRFLHAIFIAPALARRALRPRQEDAKRVATRARRLRWLTPFTLGFALLYPALVLSIVGTQGAVKWIDNFGVQILIYVMLGWGLNIVVGLAGLLDLGYVAFYAVGAYSYALLAHNFGLSFWIAFNASDEGFAARFGLEFSPVYRTIFLYYLILALALVTAALTVRLRRLPIGRAWEALREDEIACRSLGINTTNTKLTAFAMGAMFAGFAGSFFAARQGFISPESFTFMESAVIVAIVVLGGMGSLLGVAIAAVIMIGGTEIMRELDFLKVVFGSAFDPTQYRMLLFGFAMVLIMVWRPRGLIATREPSTLLKTSRRALLREQKTTKPSLAQERHG